jgi:hypothetical protein
VSRRVSDSVLREILAKAPRPPARRRRKKAAQPPRKCTYALPADLVRDLRAVCARQGVTQREVVEAVLRTYVAQHSALLRRRA